MGEDKFQELLDDYYQARRIKQLVEETVLAYGSEKPKGADDALTAANNYVESVKEAIYDYCSDAFGDGYDA